MTSNQTEISKSDLRWSNIDLKWPQMTLKWPSNLNSAPMWFSNAKKKSPQKLFPFWIQFQISKFSPAKSPPVFRFFRSWSAFPKATCIFITTTFPLFWTIFSAFKFAAAAFAPARTEWNSSEWKQKMKPKNRQSSSDLKKSSLKIRDWIEFICDERENRHSLKFCGPDSSDSRFLTFSTTISSNKFCR